MSDPTRRVARMTDIQKAGIIRSLIRASDALHAAFQQAVESGELDLAKYFREQGKLVADSIHRVNNGAVASPAEVLS